MHLALDGLETRRKAGFFLPECNDVSATQRVAHDASLHRLRVLCVDNDPEVLAGMRALLDRWGVDVTCASTVDDASLRQRIKPAQCTPARLSPADQADQTCVVAGFF